MVDLVVRRADVADTLVLVLRATGATEDLEDVEDAQVDEGTLARVVDLRALDDDGIGGQVDTPCERCGTAEDLAGRQSSAPVAGIEHPRIERTLVTFASNMRSEMLRSDRSMPAWWIPKPAAASSFISRFRLDAKSRLKPCHFPFVSSPTDGSSRSPSPSARNFSRSICAVLTVSFRAWTKTMHW